MTKSLRLTPDATRPALIPQRRRLACPALLIAILACAFSTAIAQAPISRSVSAFDRASIPDRQSLEKLRTAASLQGIHGTLEFDLVIAARGWHEVVIQGHALDGEFTLLSRPSGMAVAQYFGSNGNDGSTDKLGNVWLEAGEYTFRMRNDYWTGFRAITGFSIRRSSESLATRLRIAAPRPYAMYRLGECAPLKVEYGPLGKATTVSVSWFDSVAEKQIRWLEIPLLASQKLISTEWMPPCDRAGTFTLFFRADSEGLTNNRDVQPIVYQVFGRPAGNAERAGMEPRRTLIQSMDFTHATPDYQKMPSVVVNGAPGPYRESGDVGWERWQQAGPATASPGWFAYTLNGLTPQTLHMFEFDYPDDKERTFAVAIRESDPLSYPVAGGVDSGGAEFRSSLAFQSQRLLFWPRSREARALFITNRDGMTAAASAARLYRVESSLPPLLPPGTPGRRFINWFEEGSNFLSMYGAAGSDLVKSGVAVERWAESAAYMGISTLMPTVSIYSFVLYPSQVNRAFSRPWDPDLFRQIMLTAERHGLEVIPEIHPRADELTWLFPAAPSPRPNVLVSRSGEVSTTLPTFFNPLHPDNQKWYLDVIGELVDNYRDSPALKGISLRMMGWSNPTLHNFHSLDWGYDDLTTGLFSKETGLAIPVRPDSPTRFSERYRWLMTNARARWIDWRSDKVAQLLTRVRDRVRKSRPDLIVYLNVFPLDGRLPGVEWMRDAGLDVEKLSRIDGLVMINSMHAYGRRFGPAVWGNLRRNLLDPAIAKHLTRGGSSGHYLPTSLYFEAMDNVVPPDQLGFPASTRRTWMSAVINPAGRNYLERFAMLLADGDALTLGDGGNAYSLGQPELREFLREYRRLPALAFTRRSEPDANVAVWSRAEADGQYFYLVNRTPVTQQISLPLAGAKTVLRLGTSVDEAATAGQLRVELKPFQLQAYRAAVGVSIPAVVETSRPRPGAQR